MRHVRNLGGVLAALVVLAVLAPGAALAGAAPQSVELWGGPGATGHGAFGATFDTTLYIGSAVDTDVTVEFFQAGAIAATVHASVPGQGTIAVPAPAALVDHGPFFYRITASAAVTAWSETFNKNVNGQYGLSVEAFLSTDFLNTGDEATGVGAEASSSTAAGRSRTNVGVFCRPGSDDCRMEVAAFSNGSLLGTGVIQAGASSAVQRGLADLIPGTADHILISLRLRMLAGSGAPYVIKNHNDTSDAARIPLTASRSAFSTAPTVNAFTVSPTTGCAPQHVTLTWTTTGAARVTITGVSGDLPANGTTTTTLQTTTDVVLTAYSPSGETTSVPRHVTVLPPTQPPTPAPSSGTVTYGQTISGLLPLVNGVTAQFVQHQSTGSTFTITGSQFTYVSGSTAGIDIVRLTLDGPCGPVTADFTATVIAPGSPQILSFTADPPIGCAPANIVLSWLTQDTKSVTISGIDFVLPAAGSYGVTLTASTDFTLTAFGFAGQKVTKKITVPVDSGIQTPILSANNITIAPFDTFEFTVSGVSDPTLLRSSTVKDGSGGHLQQISPGVFRYYSGSTAPSQDVYNITYRNGCGQTNTVFTANVVAP